MVDPFKKLLLRSPKGLRFLVSVCVASADLCIGIFSLLFFFALKRCPIAAKIAGSIGILPCYVLNDFFTQGNERLPDLCSLFNHKSKI